MNTLLAPSIFYLFFVIYLICLIKNGGFKTLVGNLDTLKYYLGTSLFFFMNVNVLFYCSFCDHCHALCLPFTMCAVFAGAFVYLTHLGKQTIKAVKQIIAGNEFDLMAPFFSLPYFYLIYDIIEAILNSGISTLHAYESKMLIVLLYPLFVAVGELTSKIKSLKLDIKNDPKKH
jgi:hypothetical protein